MTFEKQEFAWEFSQLSCLGKTRTRVAWELMRVEKQEFAWEFSQLSCLGKTRTRVAWELMRVEKQEFAWGFSQLSCLGQTLKNKSCMRVDESWEARVCMRVFSTLVSRSNTEEQELHESWWELRSKSLHESFHNSRASVKREQELHESWWELRSESLHESFLNSRVSDRDSWSNKNKSCMRVDESWEARVCMRVFSTLVSR
jgi:hypothetical protein